MSLGRRSLLGAAATSAVAGLVGCAGGPSADAPGGTSGPPATTGSTTVSSSGRSSLDLGPVRRMLTARCRDDWGATPAGAGLVPHTVERLTVHHSAYRLDSADAAGAQLRRLQRRQRADGFPDIAYHYLVDVDGRVLEGRDPRFRGDTYTQYDPTGHLGVCVLGNYDRQPLTRAAATALVGLLAWASDAFGVGTGTIEGHDDQDPVTACPGRALSTPLHDGSLRTAVDEVLAGAGAPRLEVACRGAV